MFVRCFCGLNVCLDEYELFARPRVAGHHRLFTKRGGVESGTTGNKSKPEVRT